MKNIVLAVIFSLTMACAFGQTAKYSNEFLSLGLGARVPDDDIITGSITILEAS